MSRIRYVVESEVCLYCQYIDMLSRGAANITDPQRKLEEIQRQLKVKLQKAKEITSSGSLDQHTEKTQEQFFHQLEKIDTPIFDPTVNYSDQYWQTYLQNEINCALIRQANEKRAALKELISQIEDLQDEHYRLNRLKNRKKNRRMASQIEKSYLCPLYGSDVSLNLHIKIKHNGGNKTDRQKLAQQICIAEQNNLPLPPMTLNLPPGYLRQYRKLYFQKDTGYPQPSLEEGDDEKSSS